jgi:hypothetical protein
VMQQYIFNLLEIERVEAKARFQVGSRCNQVASWGQLDSFGRPSANLTING